MVCGKLDVFRPKLRLRVLFRIAQQTTCRVRHDFLRVGVVRVHHAVPASCKEHCFCLAVGVHRLVEIEVVLGEVGEDAGLEGNFVRPVQHQRVARYLHHTVRAAGVCHLRKELLQLKGLRRRALGVDYLGSDHVLNRAD